MDRPSKAHAFSPYRGPDRRRYPRYSVQVPIEVRIEEHNSIVCAETTDLSRNGCYIRLLNPLFVGLRVQATLWLDQVPIQVKGRVVTRHPDFGNGIMFLGVEEYSERALASFLETVISESTI